MLDIASSQHFVLTSKYVQSSHHSFALRKCLWNELLRIPVRWLERRFVLASQQGVLPTPHPVNAIEPGQLFQLAQRPFGSAGRLVFQ